MSDAIRYRIDAKNVYNICLKYSYHFWTVISIIWKKNNEWNTGLTLGH
jgi:hypothetical protein